MRQPIRVDAIWRPFFRVFGASPSDSFVDIDEAAGVLRVKMGIWFDETLPLREIAEIAPSSLPWYGGAGVKIGPGADAVSVYGSRRGVVAIRFTRPQRMRVLVVLSRTELRVSPEDPEGFTRALREALARIGGATSGTTATR